MVVCDPNEVYSVVASQLDKEGIATTSQQKDNFRFVFLYPYAFPTYENLSKELILYSKELEKSGSKETIHKLFYYPNIIIEDCPNYFNIYLVNMIPSDITEMAYLIEKIEGHEFVKENFEKILKFYSFKRYIEGKVSLVMDNLLKDSNCEYSKEYSPLTKIKVPSINESLKERIHNQAYREHIFSCLEDLLKIDRLLWLYVDTLYTIRKIEDGLDF